MGMTGTLVDVPVGCWRCFDMARCRGDSDGVLVCRLSLTLRSALSNGLGEAFVSVLRVLLDCLVPVRFPDGVNSIANLLLGFQFPFELGLGRLRHGR